MVSTVVADDIVVGLVPAIDNALLFLLVPWMGTVSDRRAASGRDRLCSPRWRPKLWSPPLRSFAYRRVQGRPIPDLTPADQPQDRSASTTLPWTSVSRNRRP
jgi:hypothetical protein